MFVNFNALLQAPFFSTNVTLGKNGVEQIHDLGPISALEKAALEKAIPDLISQVWMDGWMDRHVCVCR